MHFSLPSTSVSHSKTGKSYGCLFCVSGKEQMVAKRVETACPTVHALSMRQMKYRTNQGKKIRVEETLLPGYVFFKCPSETVPTLSFPMDNVIRVLTMGDCEWRLQGEDERFAAWLFSYEGLLDFSKAYHEGNRVHIVSGPLKDLEGRITSVDRRGRSGRVVLEFHGRSVPIWLNFELIEKCPDL